MPKFTSKELSEEGHCRNFIQSLTVIRIVPNMDNWQSILSSLK